MEKIIENYKGVIIFYCIIILLSLFYCYRINRLNIANNYSEFNIKEIYCS